MAALAASFHSPIVALPGLRASAVTNIGSLDGSVDKIAASPVVRRSTDAPETQFALTSAPALRPVLSDLDGRLIEPRSGQASANIAITPERRQAIPDLQVKALPLGSGQGLAKAIKSPELVLPASHQEPNLHRPGPFREHRKNALSVDATSTATAPKVAPSQRPQSAGRDLTIAPTASPSSGNKALGRNRPQTARSTRTNWRQTRPARLSNIGLDGPSADNGPSTARPSMLQSPCFFHSRFDDAVNLDRVLEEISGEDGMSHSRLMQTATGVREVSKQLRRRPIKRAVRTVMIVTKARDHELVTLTRELAGWLMSTPRYGSDVGVNVYVDAKLRHSKRFDAAGLLQQDVRFEDMLKYWTPNLCWSSPDMFDLVVTLGGDGTVLFTSWLFQRIVPPVLSFSLGSLGFLTNFQFDDYREHLDQFMGDGGMKVNLRMRFTCTVYRCRNAPSRGRRRAAGRHAPEEAEVERGEQFEVLNEVVIDRGPSPYVSNLELYGDDELLTVVQADGCIFSTPTGSTAYSLSAGGSLVHPDIPAILLTPICPHSLSFRPMLLNDSMLLKVCVPRQSRATAYCAFDGKGRIELKQGDYVTIAASQFPFPTVLSQPAEWFDSIARTLRWNSRGSVQKGWDNKPSSASSRKNNNRSRHDATARARGGIAAERYDKASHDAWHEDDGGYVQVNGVIPRDGYNSAETGGEDDVDVNDDYDDDGDDDDDDPNEAWDIDTDTIDSGVYSQ